MKTWKTLTQFRQKRLRCYYFAAYLLINLWRPPLSLAAETATLAGYILLSAFVMYGTVTGWFFL